jgi:starch synthase (maltosyl-transferring)
LLAGPFPRWNEHLTRAAAMGFDWVYVNPIQQLGASRSLYSIADYFRLNPASWTNSPRRRGAMPADDQHRRGAG